LIPIDMLPSSPMQSATSPAALLEKFGPHELDTDARKLSAKLPVEHVPSVIAEPPVAVAAYALGIICCTAEAIAVATTTANAAARRVAVKITFVLILSALFIAVLHEKLQKMRYDCKLYMLIEVICYDLEHSYKAN
jgi:hypothetical protein